MRKPTSNEDLTQRFRNSPEKKHGMKHAREQVRSFKRNIAHSIYFMLYTIVNTNNVELCNHTKCKNIIFHFYALVNTVLSLCHCPVCLVL